MPEAAYFKVRVSECVVVHNSVPIYRVLSCGLQQHIEKKEKPKNELWGTPQSQLITVIIIVPLNALISYI